MAIYVKLKNNIVIKALEADADFIATYQDGEPGKSENSGNSDEPVIASTG